MSKYLPCAYHPDAEAVATDERGWSLCADCYRIVRPIDAQDIIKALGDLYLRTTEQFCVGDAGDLWDSPRDRREADDERDRIMSAYRALGGDTEALCDARDEIRKKYADA